MPFFEYNQNNSGGGFDVDHAAGLSHIVIIEADSADEANRKAEDIGLYFNGWGDCSTCGNRWYEASDYDADDVPSHYGTPIQDIEWGPFPLASKWIRDGAEAYVHFKDGKFQGYGLPPKEL
jgi:hypothetical protein